MKIRIPGKRAGADGATANRIGSSSSGLAPGLAESVWSAGIWKTQPFRWPDSRRRGPPDVSVTASDDDAIRVLTAEDSPILRDGLPSARR